MKLSLYAVLAAPIAASAWMTQDGERSRALESIVRRFDKDGDGRVSAAEYTRSRAIFKRLDRDGDGYVTELDFQADKAANPNAPLPASTTDEPEFDEAAVRFFESKVRPVLASMCYGCHAESAPKIKGGLRVDSREALLHGGASGAAIVPGDADASLLVQALRYADENLQMPPKKALDPSMVADIARWVEMGAPWPKETAANTKLPTSAIDWDKAREWWSFRAPQKARAPTTKNTSWAWSDIDHFVLAALEEADLAPVGDADRRTWLRRVTFDLTGLPPTPEQLADFEKDRSPQAFERVVDALLASPRFGERFGRHWLDVARYAESSGKDTNVLYPHAWRYRDWVIAAFNSDKPFDTFLKEQIAGDLMPAADDDARARQSIATGYLALGSKGHGTRDRKQFAYDVVDEQIDALSQGVMGITVSCARCHDHKFDPIPTRDYYALAGVFLSTETCYGTLRGPGNLHPSALIDLPAAAHVPNGPDMPKELRTILERTRERLSTEAEKAGDMQAERRKGARGEPATPGDPARSDKTAKRGDKANPDDAAKPDEVKKPDGVDLARARRAREQTLILDNLLGRFDEQGRALPSNRLAMGVREGRPRNANLLERGEPEKAGAIVPRGFLQLLSDPATQEIKSGSGRKELAQWVASPANPLTARVWANRVWLHLFGTGIVPTPDNFGSSGQPPTHPELLDSLALSLVESGWSTKALVRRIVLSHVYRLASDDEARNARIDPEARLLWRMPERRLEAEAIRDAMLFAAGTLDLDPPVGSPTGVLEGTTRSDDKLIPLAQEKPVRSVYLPILRDRLPDALEVFDAADPSFVTGDREETNVATQALYLMNDANVLDAADALGRRLLAHEGNDEQRIALGFELALGRAPDASETVAVRQFLREFPKLESEPSKRADEPAKGKEKQRPSRDRRRGAESTSFDPRAGAWSAFAQTLFQCAEFRYLD